MRPIEVAKLALLAERSCEVAELAHLLAEAAARHAERVEAGDPERRHPGGACSRSHFCRRRWCNHADIITNPSAKYYHYIHILGLPRRDSPSRNHGSHGPVLLPCPALLCFCTGKSETW